MDISGIINLFVKNYTGKDGKSFKLFSGSLGKKNEDGTYSNARVGVRFSKKFGKSDALDKLEENRVYKMDVTDGFLSFDTYEENDKQQTRFVIVVDAATLESSSPIKSSGKGGKKAAVAQELPF